MNKPKVVAFIFARGGSKGLPKKNIKMLGDLPLIAHSIKTGLACPSISKVVVSTDNEEIAEVARKYGAEVPFIRPSELAQDTSPEWLAWQHALTTLKDEKIDYFVSLPATSPFRNVEDVESAINKIQEPGTDFVLSAQETDRSPWFNMIKLNSEGYAELVNIPDKPISRRQDAPKIWDLTTVVYVTTPNFILTKQKIFDGRVKFVLIPRERALDIDTEFDFKMAEFIYQNKLHLK